MKPSSLALALAVTLPCSILAGAALAAKSDSSAQNATRGSFKPDPAVVAEGKKIAEEAQCASCHQPGYKGPNEFPRLTRQKYPYLVKQLKDFRDGTRTNDGGVMGPTTKTLTDEQIQALAQYLSSR